MTDSSRAHRPYAAHPSATEVCEVTAPHLLSLSPNVTCQRDARASHGPRWGVVASSNRDSPLWLHNTLRHRRSHSLPLPPHTPSHALPLSLPTTIPKDSSPMSCSCNSMMMGMGAMGMGMGGCDCKGMCTCGMEMMGMKGGMMMPPMCSQVSPFPLAVRQFDGPAFAHHGCARADPPLVPPLARASLRPRASLLFTRHRLTRPPTRSYMTDEMMCCCIMMPGCKKGDVECMMMSSVEPVSPRLGCADPSPLSFP